MAAARIPPPPDGLSENERNVFALCARAAAEGRPLEPVEEMMGMLGFSSYSTIAGIMGRLEKKKLIGRRIFQRGRQVCILATGEWTAAPSCTAPHWRLRTETPPTPPIHQIRERRPALSAAIEQEARALGKPMTDFLADLLYIGWHAYDLEREREAA